jgi:hypothetical protein
MVLIALVNEVSKLKYLSIARRKMQLTILSAPMCWPTHDLQTRSGQGGHGEPRVHSL